MSAQSLMAIAQKISNRIAPIQAFVDRINAIGKAVMPRLTNKGLGSPLPTLKSRGKTDVPDY
jgi:hypothetical protein